MANLGLLNQNAGNLRDTKTGSFRVFGSMGESERALDEDLEYKKSGRSPHIKPGGTILDLARVWAPASDGNVPENWAKNVARAIGVEPTARWDTIPTADLRRGIKVAEGTAGAGDRKPGLARRAFDAVTGAGTAEAAGAPAPRPKLTREQTIQNIHAMSDQGAPPEAIQAYLDSLATPRGNVAPSATTDDLAARGYDVGQNAPAPEAVPPAPEEKGVAANALSGNLAAAGMGVARKAAGAWNRALDSFSGLAAIPVQGVAKLIGAPDPYRNGLKAGGEKPLINVSPLTVKDKAKDALGAAATTATVAGGAGILRALLGAAGASAAGQKAAAEAFKAELTKNGTILEQELINKGVTLEQLMQSAGKPLETFSKLGVKDQLDIVDKMFQAAGKSGKIALQPVMDALELAVKRAAGQVASKPGLIGRALGATARGVGRVAEIGLGGVSLAGAYHYLKNRAGGN